MTSPDGLGIYADDPNVVDARVVVTTPVNRHGHGIAALDRDEFLAAVADELDVIVIPRTDLPDVEVDGGVFAEELGWRWSDMKRFCISPNYLRDMARKHIAIAEYLDAHPPVDPAQTDALSNLIRQADGNHDKGAGALAEALLATGRITIKEDK